MREDSGLARRLVGMGKQLKVYVTPVRSAPRPLRPDERVRRIIRIRLV